MQKARRTGDLMSSGALRHGFHRPGSDQSVGATSLSPMCPEQGAGKSRVWIERPDADAMILGPCCQQAVSSKGHTVDNGGVEGQHGQGLHRPPVKHADTMVPAGGGQDLSVGPDLDIRDPRIGEFMSPAHRQVDSGRENH